MSKIFTLNGASSSGEIAVGVTTPINEALAALRARAAVLEDALADLREEIEGLGGGGGYTDGDLHVTGKLSVDGRICGTTEDIGIVLETPNSLLVRGTCSVGQLAEVSSLQVDGTSLFSGTGTFNGTLIANGTTALNGITSVSKFGSLSVAAVIDSSRTLNIASSDVATNLFRITADSSSTLVTLDDCPDGTLWQVAFYGTAAAHDRTIRGTGISDIYLSGNDCVCLMWIGNRWMQNSVVILG